VFAYDQNKLYLDCTLFMIPKGEKFLLGVLNSKLIHFVISRISPQIRGDFMRFKTIYMEKLPIAEPSSSERRELEELVEKILEKPDDPRVARWERAIDEIVYGLYGLTPEEVRRVEGWYEVRQQR